MENKWLLILSITNARLARLSARFGETALYMTASVIAPSRSAVEKGEFTGLSSMTDLKTFVTTLAGHVAAEAARLG